MTISVAIIGLGRVGSILFKEILRFRDKGLRIVAVAEPAETPGKILARMEGVEVKMMEEICLMDDSVDLIFELTGNAQVRQSLREILNARKNRHTVVATETIASMICLMLTDKELPSVHDHVGY
jgi:predicted dinucleotide-utilizing enzyme